MAIKKKINDVTPKVIEKYLYWCPDCDYSADDSLDKED
jgi:hypothetical protein